MTLGILWFMLICLLIAIYYVLDGFDLGSAILMPFVAKTEGEKKALTQAIGPVWDGNEVWLLTAGGALFAAFPAAYATSFSGFYLAIMLVLFCLILRAVSVEFRNMDPDWHQLWDVTLFIGSLLPALLFGVALGNCLQGVPLNAIGDYTGTFFGLLRPFPLLCGLLGLATIIMQGACWLSAKIEAGTEMQLRCKKARTIMQVVVLVLVCLVSIVYFFVVKANYAEGPAFAIAVLAAIVMLAGIIVGFLTNVRGMDWASFFANSAVCVALVVLFATAMFPNFIVCNVDPALSITVGTAASSDLTLTIMTVITCICVPLVLVYNILVYRAFRGRVEVVEA